MPARSGVVLALSALLLAAGLARAGTAPSSGAPSREELQRQIRFGTEMAKQGNWREALFRWQKALVHDPTNVRLHNNIAVAFENLGEYEKAEAEYRTALAAPSVPDEVRENYEFFRKFYDRFREGADVSQPEEPPGGNGPDAKAP